MKIVDGIDYIPQVHDLIVEYVTRLGRDLQFQHIDEELQNPKEKYTAPNGELLVAVDENGTVAGMVAYWKHSATRCEMKRLYITPAYRGRGLGDILVAEILLCSKEAGFQEMVLDTIPPLKAAIHIYEKMGFKPCAPYYHNPMDDVIYMQKSLV